MEPNYAGKDFSNIKQAGVENACIQLCFIEPTCVLAVYYPNNSTCALQSSVNIFDGMFHSENCLVYNLYSK